MDFISESIQKYSEQFTQPEPSLLQKINRETHLNVLKPRMLSGHLLGRFLAQISRSIHPKRILEIGTYTGYSAICLSEGLAPNGRLITIDKNAELETRTRRYFAEAAIADSIDFRIGVALEVLPTLNETWDLVFMDADKENYLNYFNLVIDQMRPGGMIIADNVLWSGKVVDEKESDIDTLALRKFNEAVHNDPRVMNVLLPVRDGLMMMTKL